MSAMTAFVLDLIRAFGLGNGIIGRDDVVLEILVGNQTAGVYDGDVTGACPLADSLVWMPQALYKSSDSRYHS